jgi:hypothetical protein
MADPVVITRLPGVATGTGDVLLTTEEIALLQSGDLMAWHTAHLCGIDNGSWFDSVANVEADLVASTSLSGGVQAATRSTTSGPDSQPYLLGPAANLDCRMISPTLKFPIDADWTIALVTKPGTNAVAAVPFGIVGDNGRAVAVVMDGTNCVIRTRSTGTTGTNRITSAAASGSWYYIRLSYNNASQKLDLRINAVDAGTATYDLIYLTSRYSLMGEHDLTANLAATVFREGGLACAMIVSGDADTDAALSTLIDDAIGSRYPSLV